MPSMTVLQVAEVPRMLTSQPWVGWLVLLYLAFAAWTWYHPKFWIKLDTGKFTSFGADQTSGGTIFHRQRATWRIVLTVVPAFLVTLPVLLHLHPSWRLEVLLVSGGLVLPHLAYFTWYFNPNLNVARNLDYIDKWHVSWAANASMLDRYVWGKAYEDVYGALAFDTNFVPGLYDEAVEARAREIYPGILREQLWTGLLLGLFFHLLFIIFYFK